MNVALVVAVKMSCLLESSGDHTLLQSTEEDLIFPGFRKYGMEEIARQRQPKQPWAVPLKNLAEMTSTSF